MGCTACTAKVQAALEGVEGVVGCAVSLDDGSATLILSGAAAEAGGREAVQRRAHDAITAAGFQAEAEEAVEQ